MCGVTLAIALARAGRRVTLIERNMADWDRVHGELMQPGGMRVLERMGLGAVSARAALI